MPPPRQQKSLLAARVTLVEELGEALDAHSKAVDTAAHAQQQVDDAADTARKAFDAAKAGWTAAELDSTGLRPPVAHGGGQRPAHQRARTPRNPPHPHPLTTPPRPPRRRAGRRVSRVKHYAASRSVLVSPPRGNPTVSTRCASPPAGRPLTVPVMLRGPGLRCSRRVARSGVSHDLLDRLRAPPRQHRRNPALRVTQRICRCRSAASRESREGLRTPFGQQRRGRVQRETPPGLTTLLRETVPGLLLPLPCLGAVRIQVQLRGERLQLVPFLSQFLGLREQCIRDLFQLRDPSLRAIQALGALGAVATVSLNMFSTRVTNPTPPPAVPV